MTVSTGSALRSLAVLAVLARGAAADPPAVEMVHAGGAAPFAAHVHASGVEPAAGTSITARLAWDFGGGGAAPAVGFNAAHVYDQPGVHAITLTMTDETGAVSTATRTIVVEPAARRLVHVAADGDDRDDGATPRAAVRTPERVAELLGDDCEVLFRRGDVFPWPLTLSVAYRDVVFRSYGAGPRPLLLWSGAAETTAAMISLGAASERVLVEDLHFDAPDPANRDVVRGLHVAGRGTAVRRCRFGAVSYAIRAVGDAAGVLAEANEAGVLGAYFFWGEGCDLAAIGNLVAGSVDEHVMRFNAERVLVADNDLANGSKRTVWCQNGSFATIRGNTLCVGPLMFGPRPEEAGGWSTALVEGNLVDGASVILRHGTAHVLIASNVIRRDGGIAVDVWGWSEVQRRTCEDVRVVNNTIVNMSPAGRAVALGPQTVDVLVANTMHAAPFLETGSGGTANAYVLDRGLGSAVFAHNLWADPAVVGWGDGWHYLWPYWSHPDGYLDPAEWARLPGTAGERYRRFDRADLDDGFAPLFPARTGVAQAGVHVDFHGRPRPLSGPVTVGAVEVDEGTKGRRD